MNSTYNNFDDPSSSFSKRNAELFDLDSISNLRNQQWNENGSSTIAQSSQEYKNAPSNSDDSQKNASSTSMKPLLYSLYIDIVLSSSPNATTDSLKKFLQVFLWASTGSISQKDFSTLYQMWIKSGKNKKKETEIISQPTILFSEFCFLLKNRTRQELDMMLGILNQETNRNLLKLATMREQEFKDGNNIFSDLPNIYNNRHLCNEVWIETVEKMFLQLDTQAIGCWDLDRVFLFLLSLLPESDKKQLSSKDLLIRGKEFMNSVGALGGWVSLKCFKIFFLQNGLNVGTIESTGKILQKEISTYNQIAKSDYSNLNNHEALKVSLIWEQSILFTFRKFSSSEQFQNVFDLTSLKRFLEFDCDYIRFLHISNYFSKKHALELSKSFIQKTMLENQQKILVDQVIVTVLIVYKQLLQKVIQASSGDHNIKYLIDEEELLSNINSSTQNQNNPSHSDPIPVEIITQNSQHSQSKDVLKPIELNQNYLPKNKPEIISQSQIYNSRSSIESQSPTQISKDLNISSNQQFQKDVESKSFASIKPNNISELEIKEKTNDQNSQYYNDAITETASYRQHSERIATEISEISSIEEDISIFPLKLDMEARIKCAEWVDVKYENLEYFEYLPVRIGSNIPEPNRALLETESEYREKKDKYQRDQKYEQEQQRNLTKRNIQNEENIEHIPITDGLSEQSDLEFEKEKAYKEVKKSNPPVVHVNSDVFRSMLHTEIEKKPLATKKSKKNKLNKTSLKQEEIEKENQENIVLDKTVKQENIENNEKQEINKVPPKNEPEIQLSNQENQIENNFESQSTNANKNSAIDKKSESSKASKKKTSLLWKFGKKSSNQAPPPIPNEKQIIESSSLVEKQKPPSPERELFDHLSLDGDGEEYNFNGGDITPASLKHMLEVTRSSKSQKYQNKTTKTFHKDVDKSQNPSSAVNSKHVVESSKKYSEPTKDSFPSRTHPSTVRESSTHVNREQYQKKSLETSNGVKKVTPKEIKSSSRGYTSAYPGAKGEPNKEIQLPSLPKSYYKQMISTKATTSLNEK